jgi:hypothetical protein
VTDCYFDDDENVRAMRETARVVGLTQLLIEAFESATVGIADLDGLRRALDVLGVKRDKPGPAAR